VIRFLWWWLLEARKAKAFPVSEPDPRSLFPDPNELYVHARIRARSNGAGNLRWTKAGWTWTALVEPGPVSSPTSPEPIGEEPPGRGDRTPVRRDLGS
jgi:hypothetical protein